MVAVQVAITSSKFCLFRALLTAQYDVSAANSELAEISSRPLGSIFPERLTNSYFAHQQ